MISQDVSASLAALLAEIQASDEIVVDLQTKLTRTQALPPEHGGQGETVKAAFIESYLNDLSLSDILHVDAKDSRVASGLRPNLICRIPGKSRRTVWIFSHMDVVAPGDREAWASDPWEVVRKNDLLYGRGVEDNQQAIVSTLLLARALQTLRITPSHTLGMVFMADEENGSTYGLAHLLREVPHLFARDDLFLVPDFGSPTAQLIEVAEKASLWLKITCIGRQCHASTPDKGINAFVAAADMVTALNHNLPARFSLINPLFQPATSTFVPSRHDANVQGINILPGRDVFYLDCRLLPKVSEEEVLAAVTEIVTEKARSHKSEAKVEVVQAQHASSVDAEHPDIALLADAVERVYGQRPKPAGIGGGTVAALLRAQGLPALVFSCIDNSCHAPNEHSSITATKNDSCVFAHLLFNAFN